MEESTESINKAVPPLFSDTLKDNFIRMGGNISDLTNPKKQTSALDIESRWGMDIIKYGAIKIDYLRVGPRMGKGWWYIILYCLLSCVPGNYLPTNTVVPLCRGNYLTTSSSSLGSHHHLGEVQLYGSMESIIIKGCIVWSHGRHND